MDIQVINIRMVIITMVMANIQHPNIHVSRVTTSITNCLQNLLQYHQLHVTSNEEE